MIILYPGSFSPVTKGHINFVKELKNNQIIDKIIIVPAISSHSKELMPFKDRFNMLKLAFQNHENVIISDYEKSSKVQGTYYELMHFKKLFNETPYLAIGADNFKDLPNWINYKLLIKEFPIIVLNRNHLYTWNKINKFNQDNDSKVELIDFKCEISSSLVRENYEANKHLLPEEVYLYLKKHKLFR